MKNKFKDFHDAWWFLVYHPYFFNPKSIEIWKDCLVKEEKDEWWSMLVGDFQNCLDIEVQKVDPITKCMEDDISQNTLTNVWLECGCYVKDEHLGWVSSHDYELDCGGDTFEEAIVKLANLVWKHYKNGKKILNRYKKEISQI